MRFTIAGWILLCVPLVGIFLQHGGLGQPASFAFFVIAPLAAATCALLALRRQEQRVLGWILLAIVVIYLVLLVSGAFDRLEPQTIVPGQCYPADDFVCGDATFSRNDNVTILIFTMRYEGESVLSFGTPAGIASAPAITGSQGTCIVSPSTLTIGTSASVTCDLSGTFPDIGEKVKALVGLTYASSGTESVLPIELVGSVTQ